MKPFFTAFIALFSISLFSQVTSVNNIFIHFDKELDEYPIYQDGDRALYKILSNIPLPIYFFDKHNSVLIKIDFTILNNGFVKDYYVTCYTDENVSNIEEDVRFEGMKKWKPGILNGRFEDVNATIFLKYSISENNTVNQYEEPQLIDYINELKLPKPDVERANKLYQAGINAFDKGKYKEADKKLFDALLLNKDNQNIIYALGQCKVYLGNFNAACKYFNHLKSIGSTIADNDINDYCK
jgi:tetratricopeptide (TPR) repeat protein